MQAQVHCPYCQALNPLSNTSCGTCGRPLAGPWTGANPAPPPPNYPQQQPPPPAQGYNYGYEAPSQPHNPYNTPPYGTPPTYYPETQPPPQYGTPPPPQQHQNQPYWQQSMYPAPTGYYPTGYQPAPAKRSKLLLWVLFTFATLLGWAAGLPLAVWLLEVVFRALLTGPSSDINIWLVQGISGLIIGLSVGLISGLTQFVALRIYGIKSGAWVFASTLGWAMGLAIALPLSTWLTLQFALGQGDALNPTRNPAILALMVAAIVGAAGGLITGLWQLLALRGQARRGGLWPIASLAIWVITFCAVALLFSAMNNPDTSFFAWPGASPILSQVVAGMVIGAIGGITGGAALAGVV